MSHYTRRDLIKLLGMTAVSSTGLFGASAKAFALSAPHVVILGGGIGGATAAKYLRIADANVKITVIEQNPQYVTCPRSNDVVVGYHTMDEITFDLNTLKTRYDLNVVIDRVAGIDTDKKTVTTAKGDQFSYDKLIVSPGVDFKYDTIEGYSEALANNGTLPHAWKAGPQTLHLRDQLLALPQGGTILISPPPAPFRCPPGPYERASMFAEWCQKHNPTAKIIVSDHNDTFTKDGPFKVAWERLYGYKTDNSMIEWVSMTNGGKVHAVDVKNKIVETDAGDIKADLINIIPPHKAGKMADMAGVVDPTGWCPINGQTFESTMVKDVFVIGDAASAHPMPKSGYVANTQAKVCAQAIADMLNNRALGEATLSNTCYSLAGDTYGVSISDIYYVENGQIHKVPNSGGVSPIDDNKARPVLEAVYQKNWHRTFVKDVFS
jgi:sulfide dehydrogenase [flavocytochrome c] flavoprotein subunit